VTDDKLAEIAEDKQVVEIKTPATSPGVMSYTKLISQGTYGIVWEAQDEKHGMVAVKIQTTTSREQINAILQEIDMHEHMCHQNNKVVKLYSKLVAEPDYHMVMERMVCSLACLTMPLTEEEVAAVVADTTEALAAIHLEGIAHRDIKPDNLMLSNDGEVKVCDFGLSAFAGDEAQLAGTLVYLPPEVAEEYLFHQDDPSLKADYAMDQWALGITTYELASGRVPFDDPDINVMTEWIHKHPAPRLEGKFSQELCDFVAACLAKDPKLRTPPKELLKMPFLSAQRVSAGRAILKAKSEEYRRSVRQ